MARTSLFFAGLEAGGALLLFALLGTWLEQWQFGAAKLAYGLTDNRLAMMCARFVVATLVPIVPPTLFLGAAFPAAVRLIAKFRRIGADSGLAAAWTRRAGSRARRSPDFS